MFLEEKPMSELQNIFIRLKNRKADTGEIKIIEQTNAETKEKKLIALSLSSLGCEISKF